MQQRVVTAGGADFWVDVAETHGTAATAIRDWDTAVSFEGVRETVEGIAAELTKAWQAVRPSEASVQFALKMTVKSGRLTGLLVEGGAEAALTVTLTWKSAAE